MNCPKCNAKNAIHQVYCASCGVKMNIDFDAIVESVGEDHTEDRSSGAARAMFALAVLAALSALGTYIVGTRFVPEVWTAGTFVPAAPPPDIPVRSASAPALPPVPGSPEEVSLPLPVLGSAVTKRFGWRRNPVRRALHAARGGDPKALDAVRRGLEAIARQQNLATGAWNVKTRWAQGRLAWADTGVTGRAGLALLGDGHVGTERGDRLGRSAGLGVSFLLSSQQESGLVGPSAGNYMYNHGIAATALAEAYAMSGLDDLRRATEKAVAFIAAAQRPSGGWDYTSDARKRADISVTAWQVAALSSAKLAGIEVPEGTLELAAKFVDALTSPHTALTGYEELPIPKRKISHPTLGPTAIALACRAALANGPPSVIACRQAAVLVQPENLPTWKKGWPGQAAQKENHAYYCWYHGTMGLRGVGGSTWRAWNEAVTRTLLDGQAKGGHWPQIGLYARDAGRVYATAMAVLTLQTTYRFP